MRFLHRLAVEHWLAGHVLNRVEGVHDRFAITFDDGPSPRNTPRLLEVLERARAHATFFLLYEHARRHPDLVRRIVEAGHQVGIHGRLHLWPAAMPSAVLRWEVDTTAAAIAAATSVRSKVYRAPFGALRPDQARTVRGMGYEPIMGDVYPADVECPRAEIIAQRVMEQIRPGSIVILHDSSVIGDFDRAPTIDAVAMILRETAARGWRSESVEELSRTS